jgi:hypothetical protein
VIAVRAILTGFFLASPAYAEEFRPLVQMLKEEPEPSYAFVRCAAFYSASANWARTSLDASEVKALETAVQTLVSTAVYRRMSERDTWTKEEVNIEIMSAQADVIAISDLYMTDFRQSYAIRGTAWEGNPIWESDGVTCKYIAEFAADSAAELEMGD